MIQLNHNNNSVFTVLLPLLNMLKSKLKSVCGLTVVDPAVNK